MPTLTADEIADYRELVGDECTDAVMSDARIRALYDAAYAVDSSDPAATQALTVVYILRRLIGDARKKIDNTSEMSGNRETRSQLFDHLMIMLKYWEGVAGIGGAGALSVGGINMDLDYTTEDLEAET